MQDFDWDSNYKLKKSKVILCRFWTNHNVNWNKPKADQSPVVQRPISANLGLRFNPGFFVSFFKSLFQIIFPFHFSTSKHQIIEKKNYTGYSFKAFIPEVRFHTKARLLSHSFEQPSQGDYQLIHHKLLRKNYFRNVGRQCQWCRSVFLIKLLPYM